MSRGNGMALFPMFLKLEGRNCVVVGAGKVGEQKIRSLLLSGASVSVIAPWATGAVVEWAQAGVITWEARWFALSDLARAFLVIAATSSKELNHVVFEEAQRQGILCNAVDDPEHCDFYFPSVVRRGRFQIAISTGGLSPALAQRLRRELERSFPAEYAGLVDGLGEERKRLFAGELNPELRRRRLHSLAGREAVEARRSELLKRRRGHS